MEVVITPGIPWGEERTVPGYPERNRAGKNRAGIPVAPKNLGAAGDRATIKEDIINTPIALKELKDTPGIPVGVKQHAGKINSDRGR